jgi:hypothetical protein
MFIRKIFLEIGIKKQYEKRTILVKIYLLGKKFHTLVFRPVLFIRNQLKEEYFMECQSEEKPAPFLLYNY